MTYKRLPYGERSALIIEGNDLRDGTIVAAELNGGELLTRTHEVLEAAGAHTAPVNSLQQ